MAGLDTMAIVREQFGDELLFFCYTFMTELGSRPLSFLELFEFMRYNKVTGILKSLAIAAIKARAE